jgi:hypothetical protein
MKENHDEKNMELSQWEAPSMENISIVAETKGDGSQLSDTLEGES